MSLTSAQVQEKIKRYPIPFAAGLVLLGSFINFYLRGDETKALEATRDDVARQAMLMDQNLVAGGKLDEHLIEINELTKALEEQVVQQSELAKNLNYFYALEAATEVSLSDLRQTAATNIEDIETPAYVGVGYNLLISGTFRQVVAYFDELENGARIYRLSGFNLQKGREANQEIVTLSLNLRLLGMP